MKVAILNFNFLTPFCHVDFPISLFIFLQPLSTMELPPYACFECATLLKKYHAFRERCLIGQSVLYGMLETTGEVKIFNKCI